MSNGLEDSIEESDIVDQTDHNGMNKTSNEEKLKPEKVEILSCVQRENIYEMSSTYIFNENGKESGSYEEVKEHDCEIANDECQPSEPGAKTKEAKKAGRLNGEEVNLIEMEACCKIGEDLLRLVNDCKTSDITFLLNGTERIKAHRSILCTRSSYFSAMLYGGWTEGQAHEIPLHGIQSSRAFLAVLYYLYGGITRLPLEIADICEVLRLSDMYGLEGLKEVASCQLRIEKCHLFHKPCSECIAGVIDCLDVSDLFQLPDLKSQSLRWIVKYFDRVYGTKNFASLSKTLQEETLALIQSTMSSSNVLDLFSRGEKLSSSIPCIKWTEPVMPLVSSHMDSCLSYIASNFPVIARQQAFLDMLKGVGWSTPLLEKILNSVCKHLTVNNCCEQLKEAMRLQNILNAAVSEESFEKEQFSEKSYKLVDSLQSRCQEFIVSNLHRVSHTEGWKHLGPKTQNEVRKSKGGLFVDIGLPRQAKKLFSDQTKRPPFGKRSEKNSSSTKASTTGLSYSDRSQGSADRTPRSVQGATSNRNLASASGLAARGRPPVSAGSANRARRSVQDATLDRTSASATGRASRGRPQGSESSADMTRRSVRDATSNRTSASATGQASGGRPQGPASSSDISRRSVRQATLDRTSASATGQASRSRPQGSASSADRSRRSVRDATLNRTSASATGQASRSTPQGSASAADRSRRSVPDATLDRTSASTTGQASRSRPQGSASSADRSRRSVQNATLERTSASATGQASGGRPQGSAIAADRSRRSVQDATLDRTSASATGQASRSRAQGSASSADRSRRRVQDATLDRTSATGQASRSTPQGSASSADRSRRRVQDATLDRTSATGQASRSRPQLSAGSADRSRRSVQDVTTRTGLTSISRTVKGTAANNTPLIAPNLQNLSKQEPSKRNSRSSDASTSRSITASISNKKRPSSSKTGVRSTTRPGGLPHTLSRSYSVVNRAKLVDVSGRKYLSDPSISEKGRKVDKGFNDSSKIRPKTRGQIISGSITMSENSNPSISRADGSRIKSARESFVGPVRLAQRGKPQQIVGDQNKKQQNVSVYSNQKDSASSAKPKQLDTQTSKRPLAAQPVPYSQSSTIQNQTITIATGLDLEASIGELTSSAVSSGECDRILLDEAVQASQIEEDRLLVNEAVDLEASPIQEDDRILFNEAGETTSIQEDDRLLTLNEAVEASPIQEDDRLLLNEAAEASPIQDDRILFNEAGETTSIQEDDKLLLNEAAESSPIQEDDRLLLNEAAEASPIQEDYRILFNEAAESSPIQEDDRILLNEAGESSPIQEDDRLLVNEAVEASPIQEDDRILFNEAAEASPIQKDDRLLVNEAEDLEASPMQEDDNSSSLSSS
ncbi:uncharacterized protein LOC116307756 [Actinia tenebrosa]|uniref:Uncharacterized protein LOC116307756 n=1 Tax=Actinia tenebrosa TaxID=6105 RepID=A0A6P8J1X8_ACTTE|nr:uncharacterized protein LOC116307756 [Actinia tenebrosa]